MEVIETAEPGLFDVPSESGSAVYHVDIRGKGVNGDPHTCTCTRYAINKNKAGGNGYQGDYCKHLRAVSGGNYNATKSKAAQAEQAIQDEHERIATTSSLLAMMSELSE